MANAAVHLYLAKKLKPKGLHSFSYFFGNLLPDAEFLIKAKEKLRFNKQHQGSEHEEKKFLKNFRANFSLKKGFQTHFLVDNYIHRNYVAKKIKKFKGWNPSLIHFLTELAMDRFLLKKQQKLKGFYDRLSYKANFKSYGQRLEKLFPKIKFQGSVILKDCLEILRLSHLTNWLKMNQIKNKFRKYNPVAKATPGFFKIFFLMRKIEKEVKSDMDFFLEKTIKRLSKKLNPV